MGQEVSIRHGVDLLQRIQSLEKSHRSSSRWAKRCLFGTVWTCCSGSKVSRNHTGAPPDGPRGVYSARCGLVAADPKSREITQELLQMGQEVSIRHGVDLLQRIQSL